MTVEKKIIELLHFNDDDFILDAFMGDGEFYNSFPKYVHKEWCEKKKGRDFFSFNKNVDWIVSRPPLKILDKVLSHSFKIAYNILYVLPLKSLFTKNRLSKIFSYGNIKELYVLGENECAVWLQMGYNGNTKITVLENF